jgi:thiol-disulfide isomerase/thioredoxin
MKALAREDSTSTAVSATLGALLVLILLVAFAALPRLFSRGEEAFGTAPIVTVPLVANAEQLTNPPALPPATISLADLKGHAVLLDFWATWCGPCQAEAPIVDRIAVRYKARGLVVIGINRDDNGLTVAGPWAKAHHLTYPIAFDDGATAHAYDVDYLPTLVMISKDGKIVGKRVGMTEGDEIERLVNKAL